MLLTMSAWALYTVLLRRRPAAGLPALTLVRTAVLPGLLTLAPSLVAEEALGGGFIPSHAANAGFSIHLTPMFATALSVTFLSEPLHAGHFAGMAAIAPGVPLSSGAGGSGW